MRNVISDGFLADKQIGTYLRIRLAGRHVHKNFSLSRRQRRKDGVLSIFGRHDASELQNFLLEATNSGYARDR